MNFVDRSSPISMSRQFKLLEVPKSSCYHKPKATEGLDDEEIMQEIDLVFT